MVTPTSQQVSHHHRHKNGFANGHATNCSLVESPSTKENQLLEQFECLEHDFDLLGAAPIKSSFYIIFAFILFAISFIFNPPEIHDFIVDHLDLVSVT